MVNTPPAPPKSVPMTPAAAPLAAADSSLPAHTPQNIEPQKLTIPSGFLSLASKSIELLSQLDKSLKTINNFNFLKSEKMDGQICPRESDAFAFHYANRG